MTAYASFLAAIVTNTPAWVWGLLVLVTALGLISLRPRMMPLWRVFITPIVFIVWGLSGVWSRPFSAEEIVMLWGGGGLVGCSIGLLTGPEIILAQVRGHKVLLKRTYAPLLRSWLIFFSHYVLIVAARFLAKEQVIFALMADVTVSGVSAGYFIGWSISLVERFRKQAHTA